MKQTAVEWLTEKLRTEFGFAFSNNILEQAKEMEEQQINSNKCYHPLTERKYTSDTYFECTICGYNNY